LKLGKKRPEMTFGLVDVGALLGILSAVFPEWFFRMSNKQGQWYTNELVTGAMRTASDILKPPRATFPIAWSVIKACDVASYYLFFKFTINPDINWTFPTAFALMALTQILGKTWGPVFFEWKRFDLSLWLAVALQLSHAAYFATIIVAQTIYGNLGYLWYVPMILALPRLAWQCYAIVLNWAWMMYNSPVPRHRHHHHKRTSSGSNLRMSSL
jgi:tryptophan-rich sensory protein